MSAIQSIFWVPFESFTDQIWGWEGSSQSEKASGWDMDLEDIEVVWLLTKKVIFLKLKLTLYLLLS